MTPASQPPSLKTRNLRDREQFDARVQAVFRWRADTGWPGRQQDLTLAARLYAQYRRPAIPDEVHADWHAALVRSLYGELDRLHAGLEVEHRTLLCLLVIQGIDRGLGFNA